MSTDSGKIAIFAIEGDKLPPDILSPMLCKLVSDAMDVEADNFGDTSSPPNVLTLV